MINTINRGAHEAFMLDHITKGTSVKTDKPVQVHMITGDEFNGQFETRSFLLRPREQWSSRYVIPVGTVDPNYPGFAYVFNPNATALSVGFTSRTSSGSFSVPGSNGLYAFPLPMDSATLLISPDESLFFVICLMNTDPVGENGADTDPENRLLPFEINIKQGVDGAMDIYWEGQQGCVYTVLYSTDWHTKSFSVLEENIVSKGSLITYTDAKAASREGAFYRVKVELKTDK